MVGSLGTIRAKTRGRMIRINVQGDNRAWCPPWMSYYLLISKEFRVEVAGRQTFLNGNNIGPGAGPVFDRQSNGHIVVDWR